MSDTAKRIKSLWRKAGHKLTAGAIIREVNAKRREGKALEKLKARTLARSEGLAWIDKLIWDSKQ